MYMDGSRFTKLRVFIILVALLAVACGGNGDSGKSPAATPFAGQATTAPKKEPEAERRPLIDLVPAEQASSETDREALIALYNATKGEHWDDNHNWLSDEPLSQWARVQTDSNGRVTGLDLGDYGLSGEIPPELGNLTALERLFLNGDPLRRGRLTGEIPPELGNLTSLHLLALSDNQLSGEIPPELGSLANLAGLYLDGNQLSGEIPPELGNPANLTALRLRGNQLSGCVPQRLEGQLDSFLTDLGDLPFCSQ